ncbi:MAG: hypothetical protein QF405_01600, partial [Roseibacillus sp.]|nr:hypothetical protein [Roseibacillus sp.]
MHQFGAAPLLLAVILFFTPCVPVQVTLSFDNNLEGFTATTGGIEDATCMVQWSETMFPTEWTTLATRWPGKSFQDSSFRLGST